MQIKVMVIEDNLSLNKSIVNMLKKEGFEACGLFNMASAKDII